VFFDEDYETAGAQNSSLPIEATYLRFAEMIMKVKEPN